MTNYVILIADMLAILFFASARYWNKSWLIFTFIITIFQVLYMKGYR